MHRVESTRGRAHRTFVLLMTVLLSCACSMMQGQGESKLQSQSLQSNAASDSPAEQKAFKNLLK
jgi:hypothetical protein